ncbi:MAG: ABC transporter permease [Neomegalonema sp.]|nr:ABC transporter permease [Neomegalonema sp.]
MTSASNAEREARKERTFARITKVSKFLDLLGLSFITPLLRIAAGDSVKQNGRDLWRLIGAPLLAIAIFLGLWAWSAPMVQTSLGAVPGPAQVWDAAKVLHQDHVDERAKGDAFYERQEARNAKLIAAGKEDRVKWRDYTGKPTYYDQIWTSIQTVFMGFLLGSIVAIPLGILCGLSPSVQSALNPLIQVFKPVSPLAWLPIVTMVVSAVYVTNDPTFSKSFLTSAITVTLCSIWPTLINTSLGVASIDKDLVNVGKVLKLGFWTKVFKLILPSALPLIFTGLRLSLGVGWMVLIAAEMLAQNPGLGKFVWDEFQNGSSQSLAKIMVAVLTIGIIGLLLDRLMYAIQGAFTHAAKR